MKLKKITTRKSAIHTLLISTIITVMCISSNAVATQKGHLKVTSKVQKMLVVKNKGKVSYKFEPAAKVLPGEMVQYNTYFENISTKPTGNIKIVNPIPKHLVYLPNSAQGKNTIIVFSVDGGRNYGKAGTLKVKRKDGKVHPATPSDYTHIQWQYRGNLAPKSKQAVSFRARLL